MCIIYSKNDSIEDYIIWVIEDRNKTAEYYLFDMNAYRFKEEEQSRLRIMFSIMQGWFYFYFNFNLCHLRSITQVV